MHNRRPAAALAPTSLLCCAICYALLLSALSTFGPRRAAAAPPAAKGAEPADACQGGGGAPWREGELIVRFREGAAEESKGAAVSSRGGRRKAKLRGESGLEGCVAAIAFLIILSLALLPALFLRPIRGT